MQKLANVTPRGEPMATPSDGEYMDPSMCVKGHFVVHAIRSCVSSLRRMGGEGYSWVGVDIVTDNFNGVNDGYISK